MNESRLTNQSGSDILPSVRATARSARRRAPSPLIFVATGGFALIDALYRLFCGTRPFDWLMFGIDFSVLVVSMAGFFVSLVILRKSKVRKRQKSIREFMVRGQQIRGNLPQGSADTPEWTASVNQLIQDVATFLEKHSPDALAVFLDTTDMPHTINPIVWGMSQSDYARLNHCLRNLRSIMENAEAYF
jgi:hypothetical protein